MKSQICKRKPVNYVMKLLVRDGVHVFLSVKGDHLLIRKKLAFANSTTTLLFHRRWACLQKV